MESQPTPPTQEELHPFLRYEFSTGTGMRYDSSDYLIKLKAKIICDYSPLESSISREIHLGDIRATLVLVGRAGEEGFPLYDVFDDSQEIHDLGSTLYRQSYGDFVEPIEEKFHFAFPYDDILYVTDFSLQPIARGQRAGISALHRFITDWENGCALIAIRAMPMQFLSVVQDEGGWPELELGGFEQDQDAATAKLENHLGGLGFKKVDRLPYMLLAPAKRQAPRDEMALEDSITVPTAEMEKLVRQAP